MARPIDRQQGAPRRDARRRLRLRVGEQREQIGLGGTEPKVARDARRLLPAQTSPRSA